MCVPLSVDSLFLSEKCDKYPCSVGREFEMACVPIFACMSSMVFVVVPDISWTAKPGIRLKCTNL